MMYANLPSLIFRAPRNPFRVSGQYHPEMWLHIDIVLQRFRTVLTISDRKSDKNKLKKLVVNHCLKFL